MPKGVANKRYTPEFKKLVIETVQEEKLSYSETCHRFEVNSRDRIKSWERIYLEKGPEGFAVERRGRGSTGRPKKLPKDVEEDLLAEVQRLRAENDPKKLASLGFGRRATPAQKTLVVQKLRQKHALKPQDQGKAKGLAACNSQTASPFGCLNNFDFKILSNFWGSLHYGLSFYLEKSRRVRAAAAARKRSNPFFAAACTPQKTPCAGLGPKELASADPTVDVGPECVLSAVSRQNARFGAKSP